MGTYVNPGNQAFAEIADEDYVDKTGLIDLINKTIGRKNKLTCVCRPRRFGKSYAARMLTAYYDCTCDSHALFDHRDIAKTKEYLSCLNQFNVIYLDISGFVSEVKEENGSLREIPARIKKAIWKDLVESGFVPRENDSLNDFLLRCFHQLSGKPFVFIIDEWDSLIREAKDDTTAQEAYINLLRSWFKNANFTPKAVAAAYMTGILPIRKDGSQSAISDFRELSMLYPGQYAMYTGFTESEVRRLCRKNQFPFEDMKQWYDGYRLSDTTSIYNPYSVMNALEEGMCRSFWGKTSASEALTDYINMNFDGLQEMIAQLIIGSEVRVNTARFQNDFDRFRSKDDILTLLVHLGYLTYDSQKETVHIPNEEVRGEFEGFLKEDDFSGHWVRLIGRSRKLLKDTLAGDGNTVVAALEEIRGEQHAPLYYNDEQALRAVIKYAYLDAIGKYIKIEEMPSGKGIADVVFIPSPLSRLPAMIVELKWDRTADGAIAQIRNRQYTASLKPFAGNILLVGINYNEKTGKHTCAIEIS